MPRISDKNYNPSEQPAPSVGFPVVGLAAAEDINNGVNDPRVSGKGLGKVMIIEGVISASPSTVGTLYMCVPNAEGNLFTSGFIPLVPGAVYNNVTPAGTLPPLRSQKGGDRHRVAKGDFNQVMSTDLTIVPVAELSNQKSFLNNTQLSGKNTNHAVIADEGAGTYNIYVAQGNASDAAWVALDNTTTITPTGGDMDADKGNSGNWLPGTDVHRIAYDGVATCKPFVSVVTTAAKLADIDDDVNQPRYGKRQGAVVRDETGLFYYATGPYTDQSWISLGTIASIEPV